MSTPTLSVQPLTSTHVASVATLLARAFDGDPAYRFLFPAPASREAGLADFFTRNLRTHLPFACTYVMTGDDAKVVATVTVRPPGGIPISVLTMVRRGLVPFTISNGVGATRRLLQLKDTYDELEMHLGGGRPYWHVHMMAVQPTEQGRGLGARLLREVLARTADTRPSAPTVLTTHTERNVLFYRREGFELVERRDLEAPRAPNGYGVYCMRREGPASRK